MHGNTVCDHTRVYLVELCAHMLLLPTLNLIMDHRAFKEQQLDHIFVWIDFTADCLHLINQSVIQIQSLSQLENPISCYLWRTKNIAWSYLCLDWFHQINQSIQFKTSLVSAVWGKQQCLIMSVIWIISIYLPRAVFNKLTKRSDSKPFLVAKSDGLLSVRTTWLHHIFVLIDFIDHRDSNDWSDF